MLNLKHLYGFIWYAQRDSNPHRLLRRQLLYPAELWAHIIIKDIIIYLGNKIKYTIYKLYNIYFLKWTIFHGPWFQDFTIYGPSVNLYILHNKIAVFYCFGKCYSSNTVNYCIFFMHIAQITKNAIFCIFPIKNLFF